MKVRELKRERSDLIALNAELVKALVLIATGYAGSSKSAEYFKGIAQAALTKLESEQS